MSPRDLERVEAAFADARAAPPDQRDRVIADACPDRPDLQREVRSLLEHAPGAGEGFLDDPALGPEWTGARLAEWAAAPAVPERIGPYVVERVLGEGGFAVVYLARTEKPPVRSVAVKLLRDGAVGRQALARFRNEQRALAAMDHPNIIKVFDFGVDAAGRPYFVMEHVPGRTIAEHAAGRRHDRRALLLLFLEVCAAVAHAHQKGVLHRDLKPSNILVREVDGAPRPVVIDFGVARALDADPARTFATNPGQIVGTLAYMAPEQLSGNRDAVDTRADIYALGAVLYELLAGRPPHDLADVSAVAAMRRVADDDPPRLGSLDRSLRGDLETIVHKALERDPADRYAAVPELAADIRAFLSSRPIAAKPRTAFYLVRTFVRRRRALVITAGVAAVALAASGVRLFAAERRAAHDAELARETTDLLLTEVVGHLERLPEARPARVAILRAIAGRTDALFESRRHDGGAMLALAGLFTQMSALAHETFDMQETLRLRRLALDAAERAHALLPDEPLAAVERSLGEVRIGDVHGHFREHPEAFARYTRAWEIQQEALRRFPGNDRVMRELSWSYERLADAAAILGFPERAMAMRRRREALARDILARDPDNVMAVRAFAMANAQLAADLLTARDAGAIRHAELALDAARRAVAMSPDATDCARDLMMALGVAAMVAVDFEGRPDVALMLYDESIRTADRLLEVLPEHRLLRLDVAATLTNKARLLRDHVECHAPRDLLLRAADLYKSADELSSRHWEAHRPVLFESLNDALNAGR